MSSNEKTESRFANNHDAFFNAIDPELPFAQGKAADGEPGLPGRVPREWRSALPQQEHRLLSSNHDLFRVRPCKDASESIIDNSTVNKDIRAGGFPWANWLR